MFKKTVETSATPHITITECKGNLVVRGSEDRRITLRLKGGPDDWTLEQQGEAFTLQARTGCHLTCPPDTTLAVDTVRGNLKVEGLAGPVTIRTVHGNASLRSVGPVALDQTFGNLRVHKVAGDLEAQTTRGNAHAQQVEGSISMGRVDGNLGVEDLQGGLAIDQVGGDVRLGALFAADRAYRLAANGNLVIQVPSNASLRLNLRAGGGVRSQVPRLVLEKTDEEVRGVLGSGEASLEADVAGDISVRPWETDQEAQVEGMPWELVAEVEGLGRQIETHIASAMAEMETRLEESLGRIDSEQIHLQVERAREQALRTAGRAAERARQTAEREAERARLRAEQAERRWQRASGQRPRPKREPVTDDERMRVLRMVEEGRLSPEQAADLLAALEGR